MRYLLDTNIIIYLVTNSVEAVVRRAAQCDAGDLVTSVIAYAEVVYGSSNDQPPRVEALNAFVEEVPVLPFDQNAALAYATIPFRRASYDRLIGAHALSLGLTVVTHNVGGFDDIPGLRVEDWIQ